LALRRLLEHGFGGRRLSCQKDTLLVSLADKTYNPEAILFDYRELGDALWPRFNGGAEGTVGTTHHGPTFSSETCPDAFRIGFPGRRRSFLQKSHENHRFAAEVGIV
jgi:hypothetical protein